MVVLDGVVSLYIMDNHRIVVGGNMDGKVPLVRFCFCLSIVIQYMKCFTYVVTWE